MNTILIPELYSATPPRTTKQRDHHNMKNNDFKYKKRIYKEINIPNKNEQ